MARVLRYLQGMAEAMVGMAIEKGRVEAGAAVPGEWALLEALMKNSHDVVGVIDASGNFPSSVHGVIHRHHGALDISSEPGKGTTFTIRFPLDPAPPEGDPTPPPQARPRPLRVLLVEDEPVVRTVVKAADGAAAKPVTRADLRLAIDAAIAKRGGAGRSGGPG